MKNLAKNRLTQAMCLLLPSLNHAAEFNVTVGIDDGTGTIPQTLSWSILQANTTPGSDVITLDTDVTISGVMKRLIDSDVTITSNGSDRRSINGDGLYRPLFVKSGTVTISNVDIISGHAEGGSPGGAGLGGALFIYDGLVTISNVTINNSIALGNSGSQIAEQGGGGMFGDSVLPNGPGLDRSGGGGLFASTNSSLGAYGGYGLYNDVLSFGSGGNTSQNGGFGGGGGGAASYFSQIGGNGGFGGAGGYCACDGVGYISPGAGGFGAKSGDGGFGYRHTRLSSVPAHGFGATRAGSAGLGGAIFVRSGHLNLNNVEFNNNQAQGIISTSTAPDSDGLGGALFVMHTLNHSNGNNSGMPTTLPTVTGCEVTFVNNESSSDAGAQNNNDDIFNVGDRINLKTGQPLTSECSDIIFLDGFE
ncbi:hypothetical protein [Marinicella sp. W31]|uniref:hypothetical protein n=1 Tax=Marinicella sp. W31 TaxID=3023713 RepID=UPI003756E064